MITAIDKAFVYVEDQDRILSFFVERLGFAVATDAEMSPGKRWLEVHPPGARTGLVIVKAADFDREPDAGYPMTFSCGDLDETAARLRAAGVAVTDPVREPWGAYIQVTDPDGRVFPVNDGGTGG